MAYADFLAKEVKSLFDQMVWNRPRTFDPWNPPTLDEVEQELDENWVVESAYAMGFGKSQKQFEADVAKGLHARFQEATQIEKAAKEQGMEDWHTGGGCMTYRMDLPGDPQDPPHFLFSDDDSGLPLTWDEGSIFGYYKDYEDVPEDHEYVTGTARELIEKMRAGTIHPLWPGGPKAPPTPPYDPKDVQTINRHRRSIGGDPLDLSAGWTVQEIREMAERIRTTGRTHNPRQAELKRKLMR